MPTDQYEPPASLSIFTYFNCFVIRLYFGSVPGNPAIFPIASVDRSLVVSHGSIRSCCSCRRGRRRSCGCRRLSRCSCCCCGCGCRCRLTLTALRLAVRALCLRALVGAPRLLPLQSSPEQHSRPEHIRPAFRRSLPMWTPQPSSHSPQPSQIRYFCGSPPHVPYMSSGLPSFPRLCHSSIRSYRNQRLPFVPAFWVTSVPGSSRVFHIGRFRRWKFIRLLRLQTPCNSLFEDRNSVEGNRHLPVAVIRTDTDRRL